MARLIRQVPKKGVLLLSRGGEGKEGKTFKKKSQYIFGSLCFNCHCFKLGHRGDPRAAKGNKAQQKHSGGSQRGLLRGGTVEWSLDR